MSRWILQTKEMSVSYGSFLAVDSASIEVNPGEIYGLLGPNGAGKTSAIRALTTILPMSHGSATIAGHPLSDQIGVRSSIGVLPESNGYPTAQTAQSYLEFYGQLFGLTQREANRRGSELLEQLGLGSNRNRIATFSRGMRQRLGLARALINDPAVLFLDEPTLGLDPAGQEEIMAYLTHSAIDNGTCVVLCSHLLDEVERVCDRVAIMNKGRIVAEGTVDEVISSSGVAGFGKVRVAPEAVGPAMKALSGVDAAGAVEFDNTRPGDLKFTMTPAEGGRSQILRMLLESGVEPRTFDLQGARLSDAFLALTASDSKSGELT